MSVSCHAYLPPSATPQDVASVLGVAQGLAWEMKSIGDIQALRVNWLRAKSSDLAPSMVLIDLPDSYRLTYHYDGFSPHPEIGLTFPPGYRCLVGPSCRQVAALFTKIVDLFGGIIDYADDDDSFRDYVVPARYDYTPSDGEEWQEWQYLMSSVSAVNEDDLARPWPVELGYQS
jgi:hypothetical protein